MPYGYGDEDPGDAFDCSGLTQWSAAQAGITLPRTAREQQKATTPVTDPKPGDLVFFGHPAHHVGIYLGGGRMIAAPHTGDVVRIQDVYSDDTSYGRVRGVASGAQEAVTSAVSTAAEAVGWDLGLGDLASKLGVLVTKGLFVSLGLALVGVGVWRAATGAGGGTKS